MKKQKGGVTSQSRNACKEAEWSFCTGGTWVCDEATVWEQAQECAGGRVDDVWGGSLEDGEQNGPKMVGLR